jgi:DNA-binding NtrC family response regulator
MLEIFDETRRRGRPLRFRHGTFFVIVICIGPLFNNDQAEWKIMKMKKMDGQVASSLASLMNAYERALIIDALVSAQGNQSQAAKLLGTSKRVIHYKIHKYGIDPRRFRMGI